MKKEISNKEMKVVFVLPENQSEVLEGRIEFICENTVLAQKLRNKIVGFKKIDAMEMSTDYEVVIENTIVKITGDLFNAFGMIDERKILDPEVTLLLKQDSKFNICLELTKVVESEERDVTKQSQQHFKPRLATLIDQLVQEFLSNPKQDNEKCLFFIMSRIGLSLGDLQQFAAETKQQPLTYVSGMKPGDA